jgi:hypothetical protein
MAVYLSTEKIIFGGWIRIRIPKRAKMAHKSEEISSFEVLDVLF